MHKSIQTAYLAPLGCEKLLLNELKDITHVHGRLLLAKGPPQVVSWTQNIWYDPSFITIKSISDAARILRSIQRNWWAYSFLHHRRMKLIEEKLPHVSAKALNFLDPVPQAPLGSWTLIDENTMLAAGHCESPMPHGEWNFCEDKINPPSRAYLKLWELFTRFGCHPGREDICLDLGASPGGWTFVLAQCAKAVIAFDRSPLDPRISACANVSFEAKDAFKIKLSDYPQASWIFSDVVCYPDKLFSFVSNLVREYPEKRYVFTIKFQGSEHGEIISRFRTLPGHITHLSHNKHELTWFKV